MLKMRKHTTQALKISFPLFIMSIRAVYTNTEPGKLDPELKRLALATLLFAVTFGVGLIL